MFHLNFELLLFIQSYVLSYLRLMSTLLYQRRILETILLPYNEKLLNYYVQAYLILIKALL